MKKLSRILLVFLAFSTLFVGCSNKKDTSQKSKVEGGYEVESIRLAGGDDWGAPNPFRRSPRGPGDIRMKLIFDSLLEVDDKGVITWLAKEYKVDGNKYTFTLSDNAKWHDGKPVTTDDIEFTINYYKTNPPVSAISGTGDMKVVDKVEKVDGKTITITVNKVDSNTLTNLGEMPIVPKHVWEKVEDPKKYDGDGAFVGCGMYKLQEYDQANGTYAYEAYEDYYGGKQVAKKVQYVPVSDPLLAFENKEIDITNVPMDAMDKYKNDPNIQLLEKQNDFGFKLLINMEKMPEFKDYEMRKAVYQAIDSQAIVDNLFRGAGSVGSAGMTPPTSSYYNPDVVKYPYDKEYAKSVLADKNLSITLLCSNSNIIGMVDSAKVAEMIKLNLEDAGVKVTVEANETKVRDDKTTKGDYQFSLVENGGWGSLPRQLRGLVSSAVKDKGKGPTAGARGWDSEKVTEIAEATIKETDMAKQKELFKELEYEVSKEAPIIFVATQSSYSMFRKDHYAGWKIAYNYMQFEQCRFNYLQGK